MQRRFLVIACLFISTQLTAQSRQKKMLGFSGYYLNANSRLPDGTATLYAGPPFWAGNLTISENSKIGFAVEAWREVQFRIKNLSWNQALSFSQLGFSIHWDYDYVNSINNIVEYERQFQYAEYSMGIRYALSLTSKLTIKPDVNFFGAYLIKANSSTTNYVSGDLVTYEYNTVSKENRFNAGVEGGLALVFESKQNLHMGIRTFYRSYFHSHYQDFDRKLYAFGFGLFTEIATIKKSKEVSSSAFRE
jgi:hypothetical protein